MDRGRTSEGPWNEPDDDSYESESYETDTYDEPPPRRRVRRDEQYDVPPRRRTRDLNTSQQLPGRRTRDSEQYGPSGSSRSSRPSTDRRTRNTSNYEYEDDYTPLRRRVRRKRRSVWPLLIGGCAIGLVVAVVAAAIVVFLAARSVQTGIPGGVPGISNARTFTKTDTIPVTLSALSSVQVCDKIGNISIKADPNATGATIITKKIVQAASQADANTEFGRIAVEVQPSGTINNPLACAQPIATPTVGSGTPTTGGQAGANPLIVNVTIPNSDGLLHTSPDSVDVQIALPMSLVPQATATNAASPLLINVQDPLGNISIDGLQGIFTIKGSSGNVSVTHAILQDGSDVETGQGNVTFSGTLAQPRDPNANATYILHNEQGKIDVTLPADTNVTLDANSNVGSIQASDFSINVKGNGGPASYRGALNNTATTPAKAVLTVNVSIGDIVMHKGG